MYDGKSILSRIYTSWSLYYVLLLFQYMTLRGNVGNCGGRSPSVM